MSDPYRSKHSDKPFCVYFATGSSQRIPFARNWIERLASVGISVYDWTRDPNWSLPEMITLAQFRDSAGRDIEAVRACDLFWYAIPEQKSEGAAVEFGVALANGKSIVVSGDVGARNIFATLIPPEMIFAAHEAAFSVICDIVQKSKRHRGEF